MLRALIRRIRSLVLSFACFHTERVLASLLLEAQRMHAARVVHTRMEWDRLSDVERAALIVAGGGDAPSQPDRTRSALESAADGIVRRGVTS